MLGDARVLLPDLRPPGHLREPALPALRAASSASTGSRARSSRCTTARCCAGTAADELQRPRRARTREWCASCALTRKRPADADGEGLEGFADAEAAKRRLLFELLELELPVVGWREREGGLAFDLLSSARRAGHAPATPTASSRSISPRPTTRSASSGARSSASRIARCSGTCATRSRTTTRTSSRPRDRRRATSAARSSATIARTTARRWTATTPQGAPDGWEQRYVSAYATMHPWEDWAETFAHYLHIRDTLQTAEAYGMRVDGPQVATTRHRAAALRPRGADAGHRGAARRLAAADVRAQRDQPQHGRRGRLPVRARPPRSSASSRSSTAACARPRPPDAARLTGAAPERRDPTGRAIMMDGVPTAFATADELDRDAAAGAPAALGAAVGARARAEGHAGEGGRGRGRRSACTRSATCSSTCRATAARRARSRR